MCKEFSAIVLRNGEVIPCDYIDQEKQYSHTEKLIKLGIKDDTTDPSEMKFARVEINPPDGDIFNAEYNKWIFRIDQSITPLWWTKIDEENCYKALASWAKEHIFIGQAFDVIENRNGIYLKDCKIITIKSGTVQVVWGGTVQKVLDGGTVQKVWGGKVQKVLDGGTVQEVWDGGTVQKVWGGGTVQIYGANYAIGEIKDSGIVILRNISPNKILTGSDEIKVEIFKK